MARDLSAQDGIGSDANYLNGDLVDGQTVVGEGINQDIVQFFQKLMDLAQIAANGNPDNEANGYQFIEALGTLKTVIPIGNWDMQATTSITVAHGITGGLSNIRGFTAIILNDNGNFGYKIDHNNGVLPTAGQITASDVYIGLQRVSGSFFDDANFNNGTINRGYIVVDYVI